MYDKGRFHGNCAGRACPGPLGAEQADARDAGNRGRAWGSPSTRLRQGVVETSVIEEHGRGSLLFFFFELIPFCG